MQQFQKAYNIVDDTLSSNQDLFIVMPSCSYMYNHVYVCSLHTIYLHSKIIKGEIWLTRKHPIILAQKPYLILEILVVSPRNYIQVNYGRLKYGEIFIWHIVPQYAEVSPTHKHEGRGFLLFRLINMREPLIMGFLTGGKTTFFNRNFDSGSCETGFDDPELAAVSEVIQFQNWNEPTQVHLALTGDPTEMMYVIRVQYTSRVCVGFGFLYTFAGFRVSSSGRFQIY